MLDNKEIAQELALHCAKEFISHLNKDNFNVSKIDKQRHRIQEIYNECLKIFDYTFNFENE